jgi:hypothetical protein
MESQPKTALPLLAAYEFGAFHGLAEETKAIQKMEIQPVMSYRSSVRRGYIVELFQEHQLFDVFKNEHWPFGNTKAGEKQRVRYLEIKRKYEAALGDGLGESKEDDEDSEGVESFEFALESHLRDFLVSNLGLVEKGLKLYESGERKGAEFHVDNGRIDILAIDAKRKFVVIELKLSQGRNKALGQLLYYMAWVDKNLGNGPCRGFIIASEFDEQLSIAISRVAGVNLAKYKMNFAIEPIKT